MEKENKILESFIKKLRTETMYPKSNERFMYDKTLRLVPDTTSAQNVDLKDYTPKQLWFGYNMTANVKKPTTKQILLSPFYKSKEDILNYYDFFKSLFNNKNIVEDSKKALSLKKGGIHIKPENKGKFTKSAKAAGEGVQEHAHKVMNDPHATTLQKRRAQFAINAKKFNHKKKHENGGIINYLNIFE